MAVVVVDGATVRFHDYLPSDDSDGDGVSNTQDAFPLDPAASVDSDHDGYPDAWNAGRSQADSTTGLVLDSFPQDSACWLSTHGSGGVCNYAATMPDYVPDQIVEHDGIVYLLSSVNRRVYRWSIAEGRYLNPYVVGIHQGFTTIAPTEMAYSPERQRLYLGYSTGAIHQLDVTQSAPVEAVFASTAMGVYGLASVGNFVLAQDSSGAWATHYIFNPAGALTHQLDWNYYSREYAWDPNSSRVYFFRDDTSPNDLHFEVIDQTTGLISAEGESPYHGSYSIQTPIRVSPDGEYILLGSGDIYDDDGLTWSGSLGNQIADARWFANGSLVTLTTASNQTVLRRLGASNLATLEQLTYTGQALRVVGSDTAMAVIVVNNGTVEFHEYAPNDDSDGDGVTNTQDAFPLDVAASVDTDRDGYPDAWNAGRSQADSTTGLVLDSYPQDSACWLLAHGNGVACDYGATIPNYIPDQVTSHGDVIYLLSSANRRVYRRSISTGEYLNPYVVGINQGFSTLAPTTMTFSSAYGRLYLGYTTGAIRYVDVAGAPAEVPFANTAMAVGGLASVGNYVLAQDGSGAWGTHYVINSAGVIVDSEEWNRYSREFAWDPNTSRAYFFRDNSSPNDLHYEVIDQVTGQITSSGETPYHGSYSIMPPIRVSSNGQYVLLGSGDIYNQNGLTWAGSLGGQINDARWFANGSLAVLTTGGNQTLLRRLGAGSLTILEQKTYAGQALRVVGSDAAMVVLVINNGTVEFHDYVPSDDSDGDGVTNTSDAFPLDVAASVDTDGDGYPDAWNPGMSQGDSTTGLSLDSYPGDSACWLLAHGDGVTCDYGATVPNYIADQVVSNGDIIYLLSTTNRRVYRWSMATGEYLNPYVVGIDQGFSTAGPTTMVFSSAHNRLYLGYETGAIRYVDVGTGVETSFVNVATEVGGLGAAGNFIIAQDFSGAWGTHYIIDSAGVITDQEEWNYFSLEYTWDPNSARIYFLNGNSSSDLKYEVVDQVTGLITGEGASPYYGSYSLAPPIRVSSDGQQILLGNGEIYEGTGLTQVASLGKAIRDGHWIDDLLVDVDTTDRVEIRDADTRAVLAQYQYTGQPLRVLFGASEAYLVHVLNGTTEFLRLPFYDQDADSIPRWWEDLYGLSDTDAADASDDLDSDGVNNAAEYQNNSNPTLADTDADGLSDLLEIGTHATNPANADSDGDRLNDHDEVITHGTDPWDTDSDNDGYTDLDEVLYGGDPNDVSGLPVAMTSYSQTFESGPLSAAWFTPPGSHAAWDFNAVTPHGGSSSLKSGVIGNSQRSGIRFRGYFEAGRLRFWARVDSSCCDSLQLLVDGVNPLTIYPSGWTQYEVALTHGMHEIEWRYATDSYGAGGADAAWIDDVSFVSP
jgi:hypothetical protein